MHESGRNNRHESTQIPRRSPGSLPGAPHGLRHSYPAKLVHMLRTTTIRRRPTMWLGTATILLAILVALVGSTAPALGAPRHGGPGEIAVVAAEPSDDGSAVHLELAVTYVNDGEAAERADVSVSGATPDGQSTGPIDVTTTDVVGTYVVDVPVPGPGDWTFSVVSIFPPATLDVPVTVAAAAPSTDATDSPTTATTDGTTDGTTDSSDAVTSDTESGAVTTPTDGGDGVAAGAADSASQGDEDDDGGLGAGPSIALAVGALAAVAGAVYAIRRRGA
jgi:hypothetical protein